MKVQFHIKQSKGNYLRSLSTLGRDTFIKWKISLQGGLLAKSTRLYLKSKDSLYIHTKKLAPFKVFKDVKSVVMNIGRIAVNGAQKSARRKRGFVLTEFAISRTQCESW